MKYFHLPIWVSNYVGTTVNCEYPHQHTATDEDSLKKFVAKDHVFICFKNNYRNADNFIHADSMVLDCDNDHSENPDEWYYPESIQAYFPGVQYVTYTSRHHMKQKEGKSARPRFHVVFFIERITNAEEYKALIE